MPRVTKGGRVRGGHATCHQGRVDDEWRCDAPLGGVVGAAAHDCPAVANKQRGDALRGGGSAQTP